MGMHFSGWRGIPGWTCFTLYRFLSKNTIDFKLLSNDKVDTTCKAIDFMLWARAFMWAAKRLPRGISPKDTGISISSRKSILWSPSRIKKLRSRGKRNSKQRVKQFHPGMPPQAENAFRCNFWLNNDPLTPRKASASGFKDKQETFCETKKKRTRASANYSQFEINNFPSQFHCTLQ